ncbi:MAG: hypothetical protein ACE5IJ_12515 [Thermoplasmata archaeon]
MPLTNQRVLIGANPFVRKPISSTESGESIFAWRKGAWVFAVVAPDGALRNWVIEELLF